jgi:hypothetical protein
MRLRPVVFLAPWLLAVAACDGPFSIIPPGYEDAAFKSRDMVTYLARQRHAQLAFGTPEIGTAGNVAGRTPRLGARVTVSGFGSPTLTGVPIRVGDQRASTIPVTTATSASLTLEGATQLYAGKQRGERRLFSLDLIGRAYLASGLPESDLNIESSSLGGALGLAFGIVNEHGNTPAVSVMFMQGRLPGFRIASDPYPVEGGGEATVTVNQTRLLTTSTRISTSKTFGKVGVSLGYGVDAMVVETQVGTTISGRPELGGTSASDAIEPEIRRTLLFGGVNYRMRGVTLGGEAGVVGGEKGPSEVNRFGAGGGSRPYLSVGVRVGN